jgi:NADH-quinone oxidoreductase subunit G
MGGQTLQALGLTDGATVRVWQGSGEAVLTARVDEAVPAACLRIAAAHVSTAALGDMFSAINVERA